MDCSPLLLGFSSHWGNKNPMVASIHDIYCVYHGIYKYLITCTLYAVYKHNGAIMFMCQCRLLDGCVVYSNFQCGPSLEMGFCHFWPSNPITMTKHINKTHWKQPPTHLMYISWAQLRAQLDSKLHRHLKALTNLTRGIESANHHLQLFKIAMNRKGPPKGLIPKVNTKKPEDYWTVCSSDLKEYSPIYNNL